MGDVGYRALNKVFENRRKDQEEERKFQRQMQMAEYRNNLQMRREAAKEQSRTQGMPTPQSRTGLMERQNEMIEGPDMTFEMPAQKVTTDQYGRPRMKETTESDKQMSFMNAYQRIIGQGKKPPVWATKVFERYKTKQNQLDTGKDATESASFSFGDEEETQPQVQPEKKKLPWSGLFGAWNKPNANSAKTPYKQFDGSWYRKVSGGWQLTEEDERKRSGLQ